MYLTTLKTREKQLNAKATVYALCVADEVPVLVISLIDIVTRRAVITTRFDLLITLASTATIIGILMNGAHINMGMFPALSTDVVEKRSILKCRDALTSE